MTSQLASQLQRLQQRPVGDKRLAQSFLFDASDARSFSREQIHELAVHGLQTLIALDNRLHPFLDELFHPHRTRVERKLLTEGERRALDDAVERFLTLLSPHLFLAAAHQVFEYLVRVHEVHVYNVPAVLRAFLPYHDHSLFARAAMLLDVRDTGFAFLSAHQERGAPLLREQLVRACGDSRRALRLLCDAFAFPARAGVAHPAANALFAGVAVRLAAHVEAEAHWRVLLPLVVEFLRGAADGAVGREALCAVLVVLAAWSAEAQMSAATLATVVRPAIACLARAASTRGEHTDDANNIINNNKKKNKNKNNNSYISGDDKAACEGVPAMDLLALMDLLFHTQRAAVAQVTFAPLLQSLLALPWPQWAAHMSAAAPHKGHTNDKDDHNNGARGEAETERGGMYATLVSVLLQYCLSRLCVAQSLRSVAQDVRDFVQCAVTALPLPAATVTSFVKHLITAPLARGHSAREGEEEEEEEKESHKRNNNEKEKEEEEEESGPAGDESVVARWLCALERRYPHRFDAALSSLLRDAATQSSAAAFLSRHLRGARYELVDVPVTSAASERLPLFACLLHPLPEARALAAEAMAAMPVRRLVAGHSLLALLAHVAQYEACERVAVQFIHCAREAAQKLILLSARPKGHAPHSETPTPTNKTTQKKKKNEKEKEKAKENQEEEEAATGDDDDADDIGDVSSHLHELARALWAMSTLHDSPNMRQALLESFLQPLLLLQFLPAPSRTASSGGNKRATKSSKAQVAEAEAEVESTGAAESARRLALYYVTLLYISVVDSKAGTEADNALCASLEKLITGAVTSRIERSSNGLFALDTAPARSERRGTQGDSTDEDEPSDKAHAREPTDRSCLDVLACVPLMRALGDESTARVPATLHAMRAQRAAPRALQLECCLAAASRLIGAEAAAEADALTAALLDFFVQHIRRLQEAALGEQQQQKRIGRGAAAAPLGPPRDALMERMGAVVRRSVAIRLAGTAACGDLAQSARLLCCLRVPLLPVAADLTRLSPAYLALLPLSSEQSDGFPGDWFDAIFTSLFDTAPNSNLTSAATGGDKMSAVPPLSALALLLLCPFAAPPARRLTALQRLQEAVLRATADAAGKTTGPRPTAAQRVFAECLSGKGTCAASVTTLGCIIEAMTRDESREKLTDAAAKLLCRIMADPSVPRPVALRVVEHFFPIVRRGGSHSPTHGNGSSGAGISFAALLPALTQTLVTGGSAGDAQTVDITAADFLQAVCHRLDLCRGAARDEEDAAAESEAALQMCVLLLRYPFLRVAGSDPQKNSRNSIGVRAVYRPALTSFANALSRELRSSDARVFISTRASAKAKAKSTTTTTTTTTTSTTGPALDPARLAEAASRALFDDGALARLGGDAARLLLATRGGYARLFRPYVAKGRACADPALLADALEALAAGPGDGDWEPPAACALAIPLRGKDARRIVGMCRGVNETSAVWDCSKTSREVFRLLCAVVAASPCISYDDDDDDDNDDDSNDNASESKLGNSLFDLISGILEAFPLSALTPFFTGQGDEAVAAACHRGAMKFVRSVVDLCVSSPQALNESNPHGAAHIARLVVKQAVVLMAALLVDEETGSGDLSRQRIDTIAELLRLMSPLFTTVPASASNSNESLALDSASTTALHIPVVALLIRLESVDFGSTWRGHTSAIDICETILTSFDVHTQVACLAQMMRLVMDPHAQLSTGDEDENSSSTLFRRLVKPNQVVNRQEMILHLINTTIKSEAFLQGFLDLQYRTGRSGTGITSNGTSRHGKKGKRGAKDAETEERDNDDDVEEENDDDNDNVNDNDGDDEGKTATAVDRAAERPMSHTNDACMGLLVATLELFAHYAELNRTTPTHADTTKRNNKEKGAGGMKAAAAAEEEDRENDEEDEAKSYVMLLELLAGNTLACVLAGINEPTFVACLTRLLGDKRAVLQLKGLEVLLDRLHHALPALELTVSDEDMEAHRRRLRDPRSRLTLMDLVRVKARPLATKRSFALFELLAAIMRAAARSVSSLATTTTTTTTTSSSSSFPTSIVANTSVTVDTTNSLWSMLALCVACMEELVRIVAGGGSLQAEKTLLNTHRASRVSAATLAKLFGSKARVQEVERWLNEALVLVPRFLASAKVRANGISDDGPLLVCAALLSAIGTVCQAMGNAFTTPHSAAVLDAVVAAAAESTAGIPPVLSRSAAGSLLRQASLGCVLRVLPSCWLMCQPYIPRVLFAAAHVHNVEDAETQPRSAEVLAVLEALIDPQLFLEACTECLRGPQETPHGARRPKEARVRVETHSFPLLFASVRRRVESLPRDALQRIHVLVDGATPYDNFWLAALQALAAAPALPPHDIVQPVVRAYSAFFIKFKARQCTRLLTTVAQWAFANTEKGSAHSHNKKKDSAAIEREHNNSTDANDAEDDERVRDDEGLVSRATLHRWLLFFTLCGHMLEELGPVMDFAFPIILPHIVATLNAYCSAAQHTMRHAAALIARTLEGALDTARRIALSQSADHQYYNDNNNNNGEDGSGANSLAAPEVFNAVMPAIVRQLTNIAYLADGTHDFAFRAEHFVVPAVRAFFAALASSRLQSKTQSEIVKALRHPSRHARRAALLCLDGIYADGGDELASRLMAEMLPAVVEMTEDRDAEVVEQARRLCVNLSNITGQDVLYAMNNN